ncbi:hypothetical protein QJS10_CPB14g01020 [Acorus calamus]|uniref:Uncharacterized protein n=1 Tax=Acorus calamus TaxID=4465 RepID=A0AAV9DAH6_ACOCL|nr:hypothetical protein QJS10_CPB14g01020 [Acorus calamus]
MSDLSSAPPDINRQILDLQPLSINDPTQDLLVLGIQGHIHQMKLFLKNVVMENIGCLLGSMVRQFRRLDQHFGRSFKIVMNSVRPRGVLWEISTLSLFLGTEAHNLGLQEKSESFGLSNDKTKELLSLFERLHEITLNLEDSCPSLKEGWGGTRNNLSFLIYGIHVEVVPGQKER